MKICCVTLDQRKFLFRQARHTLKIGWMTVKLFGFGLLSNSIEIFDLT